MDVRLVTCARETRSGARGEIRLGDSTRMDLSQYWDRVSCVYLDPPYLTGDQFILRQRIGFEGWSGEKRTVDLPAYTDRWPDRDAYLTMLRGMVGQAVKLLTDEGALFVHVDTRVDAHVRLMLDEMLGERNFVNQLVWSYQSGGRAKNHYSRKHDIIFFYRKSPALRFDITRVPLPRGENRQNHMKRTFDENGRPCRTIRSGGKTYVYYDDDPVYPGDVWNDLSHLQQKDPQRTGYDTQKPLTLLNRVLLPVSEPDGLVADLCAGSGTTGLAAAQAGRCFLMADQSKTAVMVMRRRLLHAKVRFDLEAATSEEPAKADIRVYPGLGFDDVCLAGFEPPTPWPEGVTGMDGVEQWSVGQLRDGVLHVMADAFRSRTTPELQDVLQVPMNTPDLAALIVDILGNRYCFSLNGGGEEA